MKYDHAFIHSFIHLFSTYVLSSRDGQVLCSGDTEVSKSEDGENLRHAFVLMNIQSLVMWVLRREECGPWVFMVKESLSEKGRVKPWVRRSLATNLILSFSSFKFLSCPQSSPAWPDPCLPPQRHAQPLSLLAGPESWAWQLLQGARAFCFPRTNEDMLALQSLTPHPDPVGAFSSLSFNWNTASETSDFKLPTSSPHFSHSWLALSFPSLDFSQHVSTLWRVCFLVCSSIFLIRVFTPWGQEPCESFPHGICNSWQNPTHSKPSRKKL